MKILLVEDDRLIGTALSEALTAHQYMVDVVTDGQAGLELATSCEYDLILLDLLIPKLDGISLCRQLRSQGYEKPILLLTAKDSHQDIVTGLDAGADDYVIKPYDLSELLARIRALLRRVSSNVTYVLNWGDLCLNPVAGEVTFQGKRLPLTAKEYNLLELFLRNPQRVFSRSAIIDRLWSFDDSPTENAVTTHIKDLRRKLKSSGLMAEIIETVYGLGYRLNSPPVEEKINKKIFNSNLTRDKGLASINRVLEKFRDTFPKQIAVLDEASTTLLAGNSNREIQQKAKQEAHKLAGSLGIFGYPEGSQLARKIEHLLIDAAVLGQEEILRLEQLVVALKQEMTKPPIPLTLEPIPVARTPLVLIIDRDVALTERLKAEAVAWGMQIEVATDLTAAKEAIELADSSSLPDVILLDLTFPNPGKKRNKREAADGLSLLAKITKRFPRIPVLAFTGRDSLENRVAVSRLGGRGFLHKPLTAEQILQAIAQVLPPVQTAEAKILLVDDDPAALAALSHLLQPWGLQVTSLDNSQRFWEVLNVTAPDLLVLDLEMPTFNGIDLCKVVRQDPRWGDLPILVVTAHTDAESIQRVFAAGADDFIAKPVLGPELVTRVMSRIERVRLRQRAIN